MAKLIELICMVYEEYLIKTSIARALNMIMQKRIYALNFFFVFFASPYFIQQKPDYKDAQAHYKKTSPGSAQKNNSPLPKRPDKKGCTTPNLQDRQPSGKKRDLSWPQNLNPRQRIEP